MINEHSHTEHCGHHHHDHHHIKIESVSAMFLFCIALNILFVVGEALAGIFSNSLGLVSDAGHNLSDVLGIILSMIAYYLNLKGSNSTKKVSRMLTVVNASLLIIAVVIIVYEAIGKIVEPEALESHTVIWVALAGIFINGITAHILNKDHKDDVNIKAAYLHAATDALVSVGVVISGIVISFTGLYIIDPLLSLVISVIILIPSLKLMVKSISMLVKCE